MLCAQGLLLAFCRGETTTVRRGTGSITKTATKEFMSAHLRTIRVVSSQISSTPAICTPNFKNKEQVKLMTTTLNLHLGLDTTRISRGFV